MEICTETPLGPFPVTRLLFSPQVYEIVTAPNYRGSSASFSHDIAVLVLEQRSSLSQFVTPVCINWTPENEIQLRAGEEGMVSSLGAVESLVEPPNA